MMDITMRQALGVWSELESAYNGTNGYGGNTAEIYAYRLQQRDPTAELQNHNNLSEAARKEQAGKAADNLKELIAFFLETHDDCTLTIDGEHWQEAFRDGFYHRCHVRIRMGTRQSFQPLPPFNTVD